MVGWIGLAVWLRCFVIVRIGLFAWIGLAQLRLGGCCVDRFFCNCFSVAGVGGFWIGLFPVGFFTWVVYRCAVGWVGLLGSVGCLAPFA